MEKQIIIIKDWLIFDGDPKEILKNNEFYRVENETVCIIDYDKSKVRPYVKSILNRIWIFPEMKLLKWSMLMQVIIGVLLFLFVVIMSPSEKPLKESTKQIIDAISKISVKTQTNITTNSQKQYGN